MVLEVINAELTSLRSRNDRKIHTLEFGCGDGFQIPFLEKLGNVVASDIYVSDDVKKLKDVTFVQCSITNAPFQQGQFDLVFSSQVLEHIEDVETALSEVKKIGTPHCIYAFTVPTNFWLLLSIPAQYYNRFKKLRRKVMSKAPDVTTILSPQRDLVQNNRKKKEKHTVRRIIRYLYPGGHGAHSGFIKCYRSFRIKEWRQLFSRTGFSIQRIQPLLLYGPSEWPLIPTTHIFNRTRMCSSVLFLMKKGTLSDGNTV